MNTALCPDPEELRQLLLGRVSGPHAEQLEEHLLQCRHCSTVADTVSSSDELVEAIRTPENLASDEELLPETIARARQLRHDAPSAETVESAEGTSQLSACPGNPDDLSVLRPSEQAGEIGRLGSYRVLELLGAGGMGVVFRAEDPKLERQVALKAMRPAIAARHSAKERFLREARAAAAIDHENIVHIYEVGEDQDVPYIAMQFLPGESLHTRLDRVQRFSPQEVIWIGREIAAGLAAAHDQGLVHRDIKPDNIWLESGRNRVKILDFGLALSEDQDGSLTQFGTVLGTPRYMAPEQAAGERVDHRCDLFSLGSVLYHLLCGQPPFQGKNLSALLLAVSQASCVPVEQHCPGVDPRLASLIARLMSKDPSQRPQSAAAVVEILRQLEDSADRQLAPTTSISTASLTKNLRSKYWIIAASVFSLAAALLGGFWAADLLFKVETKNGTLLVKVSDEDFVTSIKGKSISIKNTKTGRTYRIDLESPEQPASLEPGEYRFELTTDEGLRTRTNEFTIQSGQENVVEVWWEPTDREQKPEVVTFPNTLTVAQDGSGQYRTIAEALESVKPGMVIQVLDDSTYSNRLVINDSQRHQGIELRSSKATLELPGTGKPVITIENVQQITISGFRFVEPTVVPSLHSAVDIRGDVAGLRVEELGFDISRSTTAISIGYVRTSSREAPVVIESCVMDGAGRGIEVGHVHFARIENNQILRGIEGIQVGGDSRNVQVAGNLIYDCMYTGIDIEDLATTATDIVVTNNTMHQCGTGVRFIDHGNPDERLADQVSLFNNLFVQPVQADISLLHGSDGVEGADLSETWPFRCNLRSFTGTHSQFAITKSEDDLEIDDPKIISDLSSDSDYMVPETNSPLATAGTGSVDPSLPVYIGARPPKGKNKWNWDTTWHGPDVLTVSQNPRDRGQFRSLGAALKELKSGMTIRVLDDATYNESIQLTNRSRSAGVTIEGNLGATLNPPPARQAVRILNVPDVTIRGFRMVSDAPEEYLILVALRSPGVTFEKLSMRGEPGAEYVGVDIEQLALRENDAPVVVRECEFHEPGMGVRISGLLGTKPTSAPTGRIKVVGNRIRGGQLGVKAIGSVYDTQIVGNLFCDCSISALLFDTLLDDSHDILVSNNTMIACVQSFKLWARDIRGTNHQLFNNLVLESPGPDFVFVDSQYGLLNPDGPGNVSSVAKSWNTGNNWREVETPSGESTNAKGWIPLAESDRQGEIDLISRDPDHADYLRPPANSELTSSGAGAADPRLPGYIGSVPPRGVDKWDWTKQPLGATVGEASGL